MCSHPLWILGYLEYHLADDLKFTPLMVTDDSMTGRVENGDLVLVQKGLMPESKDMAVIRLEDEYILERDRVYQWNSAIAQRQ